MGVPATVSLVTLGCARNEADSEELAGRLAADGFRLVSDPAGADAVVVNTCGFIAAAKKDSIDTLLAAADGGAAVVAVGCLAERYGTELAASLPEADAVLGFDDYPDVAARLREVLAGVRPPAPTPRDRRTLLPVSPAARQVSATGPVSAALTGAAIGPVRARLRDSLRAPVKLASGCDRRCAFCAIPRFRGSFLSRPPDEILAEVEWLVGRGVREVHLVSENSTSYGKDLRNLRALEALLPQVASVPGVARVRVAYLQPAEMRPGLISALGRTAGVAPWFDLSFQHASAAVLRRMRRFGDREHFLELLASVRRAAPAAGVRSNVIVGFPGETRSDVAELERFLIEADLDAVGVFSYSDEDGTEAAGLTGKVPPATIRRRWSRISTLVEELTADRARRRIGEQVEVLVEQASPEGASGYAAHQGPDSDGECRLPVGSAAVGDLVTATVVDSDGVDLVVSVASGTRVR